MQKNNSLELVSKWDYLKNIDAQPPPWDYLWGQRNVWSFGHLQGNTSSALQKMLLYQHTHTNRLLDTASILLLQSLIGSINKKGKDRGREFYAVK